MPKASLPAKSPSSLLAPTFLIASLVIGLPFLSILIGTELIHASGREKLSSLLLSILLEGFALCAFWRRLRESIAKNLIAVWYCLGLWAFMVGCLGVSLRLSFLAEVDLGYYLSFFGVGIGTSTGIAFALLWVFSHRGMVRVQSFVMLVVAVILGFGVSFSRSDVLAPLEDMGEGPAAFGEKSDHGSEDQGVEIADEPEAHATRAGGHGEVPKHAAKVAKRMDPEPDNSREVHWGYNGDIGPENWASLNSAWELCGDGKEQTPVEIPRRAPISKDGITLNYRTARVGIVDNGHTIQVNVPKGHSAMINGQLYTLKQFHFHSPSEHEINGTSFPMEVHFVHMNKEGGLAVIGAMIEKGSGHKELGTIMKKIPNMEGPEGEVKVTLNLSKILPSSLSAYQYQGSLTTPPCSEGVAWSVLKAPIELSAEDITLYRSHYSKTNRLIQPMGARKFGPIQSH